MHDEIDKDVVKDKAPWMQFIYEFSEKNQQLFMRLAAKNDCTPIPIVAYIAKLEEVYPYLIAHFSAHQDAFYIMQLEYWQGMSALWQKYFLNINHEPLSSVKPDKRFLDPEWSEPLFAYIKDAYFLSAQMMHKVLRTIDEIPLHKLRELDFYLEQIIDAFAPTNFFITNPTVIKTTIKEEGANLLKGMDNLLRDIRHSNNFLEIKMTDSQAFALGKNLAMTPGKVIYRNRLIELIHYIPQSQKTYKYPILFIPPWINKFYIFDLTEQKSMVNWLLGKGYSVFMISWVNPDQSFAETDFSDYMLQGTLAALKVIRQATQVAKTNVLGFCIGGTLLVCTLAYLAAKGDEGIKSASFLATLIDFEAPGDLGILLQDAQSAEAMQRIHAKGYYSGRDMAFTFNLLRANELIWSYYVKNYLLGQDPEPFDLLYWNADPTNLPEAMYHFYLQNMYVKNLLIKQNGIRLNNMGIDVQRIKLPCFCLATELDHIAPWQSVYRGMQALKTEVQFVLGQSGHIAGVINPETLHKYGYYTNENKDSLTKDLTSWIAEADKHAGSWWPYWEKWLRGQSGEKITAVQPGSHGIKILGDAPGTYVFNRL